VSGTLSVLLDQALHTEGIVNAICTCVGIVIGTPATVYTKSDNRRLIHVTFLYASLALNLGACGAGMNREPGLSTIAALRRMSSNNWNLGSCRNHPEKERDK
jgi:hypothetical protein